MGGSHMIWAWPRDRDVSWQRSCLTIKKFKWKTVASVSVAVEGAHFSGGVSLRWHKLDRRTDPPISCMCMHNDNVIFVLQQGIEAPGRSAVVWLWVSSMCQYFTTLVPSSSNVPRSEQRPPIYDVLLSVSEFSFSIKERCLSSKHHGRGSLQTTKHRSWNKTVLHVWDVPADVGALFQKLGKAMGQQRMGSYGQELKIEKPLKTSKIFPICIFFLMLLVC